MTHENAGHYAAKHPRETPCDPLIEKALKERVTDGRISCAAAHKTSRDLGKRPDEIGKAMDLLEIRLCKCQLGLFGYGNPKKILKAAKTVSQELKEAIEASLADGRISCAACWAAAEKTGCSKPDIAGACEALKVKISPCQLGAF